MTLRTSILPLLSLFLVLGAIAPPAAGQATRGTGIAELTRQEIEALRDDYLALDREIQSRQILSVLRSHPAFADSIAHELLDEQYGIRLAPEFQDFTLRDLHLVRNDIVTRAGWEHLQYGNDNIMDIYRTLPARAPDTAPPFVALDEIEDFSAVVVAIVKRTALTRTEDGWLLKTNPLVTLNSGSFKLCEFDRFYGSPAADLAGTGFLVDSMLVATAGHVVSHDESGYENFLNSVYFLFDFVEAEEGVPDTVYSDDQVYEGAGVLNVRRDERSDWAVIRLDRPVVGREPVPIRRSGRVRSGTRLNMIGHPLGLPQKFAVNATVLEDTTCGNFYADLDNYSLNSGSPVFGAADCMIEGVLVWDVGNFTEVCGCYATDQYRYRPNRPGAKVTSITEVTRYLASPDSIDITCTVDVGIIAINGVMSIFQLGETRTVPWPEFGMQVVRDGRVCRPPHRPQPGERWVIAEFRKTGRIFLERACYP